MNDERPFFLMLALLLPFVWALVVPAVQGAAPTVLRRKGITDTNFNETAYFVLVPDGWKIKGSVSYSPPPNLSKTEVLQVDNATETRGVAVIRGETSYTYGTGPVWQMMMNNPAFDGTYNGLRVLPPMPAADFVEQMVLPQLQQQLPDLALTEIKPDIAAINAARKNGENTLHGQAVIQSGGRWEYDAVQFKGRYSEKGVSFDLFGGLLLTRVINSIDGMSMNINWGLTTLFTLYTERGQIEEAAPLLVTILKSIRLNPGWYVKSQNYRYRVWQQARDAQAEISSILERNNRAIRSSDGERDGFSEYIRGTEVYKNPETGDSYEVGSSYDHVWFNKSGDVIFSDSPSYTPNTDPRFNSQNWSEGEKNVSIRPSTPHQEGVGAA